LLRCVCLEARVLQHDGNFAFAKRAVKAAAERYVQRLAKTYKTLPLLEVART
jgi:hypothetical protein